MAGVEDDRVTRAVEHAMHRHRELHDAEVRAEVTAGAGHRGDQHFTDLGAQTGQILRPEPAQVFGAGDLLEQHQISLDEAPRKGSSAK